MAGCVCCCTVAAAPGRDTLCWAKGPPGLLPMLGTTVEALPYELPLPLQLVLLGRDAQGVLAACAVPLLVVAAAGLGSAPAALLLARLTG
jgi:hypothetical protein